MTADSRHKYVVVLGSCCSADPIRTKNLEDIRGAKLRLLWYQGRTSLLGMGSSGLDSNEFTYTSERENATAVNWGLAMVVDEVEKRQQGRLAEVISMSDALIFDAVSAFVFPHLVARSGSRYFLRSKEWERYIVPLSGFDQRRLWEVPIQLSVNALREVIEPLYERQPDLRLIFHLPRPCFNDGITFDDPELVANVNYYHEYGERLYSEAARIFPRVSIVSCGGERGDPLHYNGPHPFHYDENYMAAFRNEIERLLE